METPMFDLPTALSVMADYPEMLRRFGFIREIEVDLAGTGIDPHTVGTITVTATPSWTPQITPDSNLSVAPVGVTGYLSPTRFALTPDGRVDPAAANLDVIEIDTDSAGLRTVDLGRQAYRSFDPGAAGDSSPPSVPGDNLIESLPDQLALPSLRNAGLSIVVGDRAVALRERLTAGQDLHTTTDGLTLDDPAHAVKGYLVDVWDDRTKRWHPLCARRGTYRLPGGVTATADDDGPVSLGVTTAAEGGGDQPAMYLHQSLARWTGWSLAASRPGAVVDAPVPPPAGTGLPGFTASFVALPGSLPTLRYGVGYRFQLRAVDVAGNADPLDPSGADLSHAFPTTPRVYRRFDPVVAPIVIASAPMTEGESAEKLVLRPDPWAGGIIGSILAPILSTPPIRHLAPPRASELLCEEHGMFDDARGRPQASKYAMIAQRDAVDNTKIGTLDPNRTVDKAHGLGQRYYSGTSLPVSWLADPLSRGAAVALPSGVVKLPFSGAWPDVQSVRLQVADGTHAPGWSALTRMLTVYVPRGETWTARLSSYVNAGDLPSLGQYGWLVDSGAAAGTLAAARADITAGRSWQTTPYKVVTLVNAVRVPVTAPVLATATAATRPAGATNVEVAMTATVHRPSTGHLAVQATWTDPVDTDPAGPTTLAHVTTPPLRAGTGDAAPDLAVSYDPDPTTGAGLAFTAVHAFGDTRRHVVTYSLIGTTRYVEHFVQRAKIALPGTTAVSVATAGIAPGTDVVRSGDLTVTYRRDVDYTVNPKAGTIARLAGGTIPAGATVEVAIVALPVSRPSPKPLVRDIPSTVRPLPPKVAWIVPTFGWTKTSDKVRLTQTQARHGGGLRVFLERPWYSSGTGEQLAVVVADGAAPTDTRLLETVTRLGADPVRDTTSPDEFPAPADFPTATAHPGNLASADVADRRVAAAVHNVVWDPDRQRWACDIVLPPGKVYGPFVRLCLARYQPGSIKDVELSPVATVEWVQLAADRTATVQLDRVDLKKVTVAVAGRPPGRPDVVSAVVQSAPLGNPGDLDWVVEGSADGQPLTAATQPDGTVVWSGTICLAGSRLLRSYRLVLTETETYDGGGRLVYSDVIRL